MMKRGVSVVELLVVMAVVAIGFSALFALSAFALGTAGRGKQVAMASELARQEMEAVISYRNAVDWNSDDPQNQYDGLGVISTGADYHMATSTGDPVRWMALAGAGTSGGFTRTVRFETAQRNSDSDIVETGGTDDPDTKRVTVTVSWVSRSQTHEVELRTYLTNWR